MMALSVIQEFLEKRGKEFIMTEKDLSRTF
jgi:hypothetical protein